jgi:tRNA C32,U32 (ribose-2'-O)-methylase TrmJ
MIVSIPTSEEYPVMNLSHSAAILFYELSGIGSNSSSSVQMAGKETLNLLQERAGDLLADIAYPEHKEDYTLLMLRRIFGRAELTEREARALLGIIKRIRWRIGHGQKGSDRD